MILDRLAAWFRTNFGRPSRMGEEVKGSAWVDYAEEEIPTAVASWYPEPVSVTGVDDAFFPLLIADARAWGVDPKALASVMISESGLLPTSANVTTRDYTPAWFQEHFPNGKPDVDYPAEGFKKGDPSAIGLNQIVWSNWKTYLGAATLANARAYLRWPASEQWARVGRVYFGNQLRNHPSAKSARDLYWLNFYPGTFRPSAPTNAIVTDDADVVSKNPGLVLPGESVIRAAGLDAFLARPSLAARKAAVYAAIDAALAAPPEPNPAPFPSPIIPILPAIPVAAAHASGSTFVLFGALALLYGASRVVRSPRRVFR